MEKDKQSANDNHVSKTSPAQLEALLAFMEKERSLTEDKSADQPEDQQMWSEISDVLNRIPGSVKSSQQWQKAWRYLEFKTWTKFRQIQTAAASKGNRLQSIGQLTEYEKRVVALADWEDMTGNFDNDETSITGVSAVLGPNLDFKSTTSSSPFVHSCLDKPFIVFGSTSDFKWQPTISSSFNTKKWDFGQPTAVSSSSFENCWQSAAAITNISKDATLGTSIAKYEATIERDTVINRGRSENINTKIYCISAMREYKNKSLEELRYEDYLANRKGRQYAPNPFEAKSRAKIWGIGQQTAISSSGFEKCWQFAAASTNISKDATLGTSLAKYEATIERDTVINRGRSENINTKIYCISAMREYKNKSMEELRYEDYLANRKGRQYAPNPFEAKSQGLGVFTTSPFGQSLSTNGFGTFVQSPATQQAVGQHITTPDLFRSTVQPTFVRFGQEHVGSKFTTDIKANAAKNFRQQNRRSPFTFTKRNTSQRSFHLDGDPNTGAGNNPFDYTIRMGSLPGTSQQQQPKNASVHDDLLSKITTPYGDNPVLKDFKNDALIKATYPSIKNAIDNVESPFRVSAKSRPSVVRVMPIGAAFNMKSLFDDLETFDVDVESFKLKPQAKTSTMSVGNSAASKSSVCGITIPAITEGPPNGSTTNGSFQLDSSHSESIRDRSNLENVQQHKLIANNSIIHSPETSQAGLTPPSAQNSLQSGVNLSENAEEIPIDNIDLQKKVTESATCKKNERSGASLTKEQSIQTPLTEEADSPRKQDNPAEIPNLTYEHTSSVGKTETVNANIPKEYPRNFDEEQQPAMDFELGLLPGNTVSEVEPMPRLGSCEPFPALQCTTNLESSDTNNSTAGIEHPKGKDHPTGINLKRSGYYTVPSMDDLKLFLAKDGSCVVPYFEVGRTGYGNVYFDKEINVAGLNLDEIVYFRKNEVIMYPDDDKLPPIGQGLNRQAQVTLYHVWPLDMGVNAPITDPQRLVDMDWENKLRSICKENGNRFMKYIPETGTWIFLVKHFSKQELST